MRLHKVHGKGTGELAWFRAECPSGRSQPQNIFVVENDIKTKKYYNANAPKFP